jgi:hypothetical protein
MDDTMSKIDDVYNAIVSQLETSLPGWARLPNPYEISENPALILKQAFGVVIGSGINTQRYVGCFVTWERSYIIGLVTQVVNTENDTTGRANIEKAILNAHRSVFLAFEKNHTIGGAAIKSVVENDEGVNYLVEQQGKFLAMELTLTVEYQEPID